MPARKRCGAARVYRTASTTQNAFIRGSSTSVSTDKRLRGPTFVTRCCIPAMQREGGTQASIQRSRGSPVPAFNARAHGKTVCTA